LTMRMRTVPQRMVTKLKGIPSSIQLFFQAKEDLAAGRVWLTAQVRTKGEHRASDC